MAEFCPGRPAPLQVMVYVCAPVPWRITVVDPEVASEPDQAPLAVHPVALVLDQVSVALWPGATAAGLMEMIAVAFGGGGVEFIEDDEPPLQPERTKAEKRNRREAQEQNVPPGACKRIRPPFR